MSESERELRDALEKAQQGQREEARRVEVLEREAQELAAELGRVNERLRGKVELTEAERRARRARSWGRLWWSLHEGFSRVTVTWAFVVFAVVGVTCTSLIDNKPLPHWALNRGLVVALVAGMGLPVWALTRVLAALNAAGPRPSPEPSTAFEWVVDILGVVVFVVVPLLMFAGLRWLTSWLSALPSGAP